MELLLSGKGLDNGLGHLWHRYDGISHRTLCGAIQALTQYISEGKVNCKICLTGGEEVMQDGVRVSGNEPDLSEEEYKKLFTREVTDGGGLEFHYPAVKDMTPEQLVDHIEMLRQSMLRIRIASQAAKITLEERKIHLGKEEREALRLRDLSYKPKKVEDPEKAARAPRKKGTAKTEDAIELMMKLYGITREKAESKLRKIEALESMKEE